MKGLHHISKLVNYILGRKKGVVKNDDVEPMVSSSISLEEAYRLYKKQQKKRGF